MTLSVPVRRLALAAAMVFVLALAAAPAIAADHDVHIVQLTFDPAEITIAAGDTVTWEVTESIGSPHSVTSGRPDDPGKGSAFDSGADGLEEVGDTFEHTFSDAGTFAYYCTVHGASMSGTVTVLEAGASLPPGGEGPGVEEPGGEAHAPIPPERKLLAAGVLLVTLVVLFVAAAVWRRMNRA